MPGGQYGNDVSHLDDHCRWLIRAGRSAGLVKQRRMHLQYLNDFLDCDPFYCSESDLESWQDSLPPQQIRNKTALVRPYFGWVHAKGLRGDDPSRLLVTPRGKRGIPRPIGTEDLELAVRLAPQRILPWLLLAAYAGLRAKEIAHLCVRDFTVVNGCVFLHLRRTKGEVERTTAIPMWVWEVISPLMPEDGPCWKRERGVGPVTPQQVSQHTNDHLHKCGIRETLHTLRHWAGTAGIDATDNLRLVQEFLGHARPDTTAVYTQVRPERIAVMVEQFPRIHPFGLQSERGVSAIDCDPPQLHLWNEPECA